MLHTFSIAKFMLSFNNLDSLGSVKCCFSRDLTFTSKYLFDAGDKSFAGEYAIHSRDLTKQDKKVVIKKVMS